MRSVLLTLVVLSACRHTEPQRAQPEFRITLSHGGGFTGMTSGHHLRSDGTLTAWRRGLAQDEQIEWTVQHTKEDARLRAEGLRHAVGSWRSDQLGNMTTHLEFTLCDSIWTWTWPGNQAPAGAPQSLSDWLSDFDRLTRGGGAK